MGQIRKLDDKVNIIGKNLKKYRKQMKLSQEGLCSKLQLIGVNMYNSDIYEIENNKRLVKDFEAKAFSIVLNINLDELYGDTSELFYQ